MSHAVLPRPEEKANLRGRVHEHWAFVGGRFPLPAFEVSCPICGSGRVRLRHLKFHERKQKDPPWRCDVSMKCWDCSAVLPTFGVAVPKEVYDRNENKHPYRPRDIRAVMGGGVPERESTDE